MILLLFKLSASLCFLTETGNEMVIGWDSNSELGLELPYSTTILPYSNQSKEMYGEMNNFWMDWRKHCFTWADERNFTVSFFVVTQNLLTVIDYVFPSQVFDTPTCQYVICFDNIFTKDCPIFNYKILIIDFFT